MEHLIAVLESAIGACGAPEALVGQTAAGRTSDFCAGIS